MIWNDRIRELRENTDITLLDVAKRLDVTEATAQRYESPNGIKNIPYEQIVKYATMFNVNPAYIMGWVDEPTILPTNLSTDESELLNTFRSLNTQGQQKLIERSRELLNLGYQRGAESQDSILDGKVG